MPAAARQSKDGAGLRGPIIKGACTVIVNGMPAGRQGDICSPHPSLKKGPHKFPVPIITGSCKVIAQGKPFARVSDRCPCGCSLNLGSCDVQVG